METSLKSVSMFIKVYDVLQTNIIRVNVVFIKMSFDKNNLR